MKRSLKEATTQELIEALSIKKDIEYIETDESERCQITVASAGDAEPARRYQSAGSVGPEIIIRYRRRD